MPFNARPAKRFCTWLWLEVRFDELLRRLNAGSDDDGDSEGDGEDDIEGESEESGTW